MINPIRKTDDTVQIDFLEPNPFASRLHVLNAIIQGADRYSNRVNLHVPPRGEGIDLTEFNACLPKGVKILTVGEEHRPSLRNSVTWRSLNSLARSARTFRDSKHAQKIVLTAVDDYVGYLLFYALLLLVGCPRADFYMIRYRVDDLVADEPKRRVTFAKRVLFSSVKRLLNAHVITFDERVPTNTHCSRLPDPWFGPFGSVPQLQARKDLGYDRHDDIVTLVGYQDDRKGFDVASDALVQVYKKRPAMRVIIVGKISPDMRSTFNHLTSTAGSYIRQYEQYVSDAELARIMAASSTILLPYHRAFTSTSGVLARAAASGTPVIASDHGIVGWRVVHYGLGRTFRYPRAHELAETIINELQDPTVAVGAPAFAAASSLESVSTAFEDILQSD